MTIGRLASAALSDADAVTTANRAFYEAHERRQFDAMCSVWEQSDRSVCIHPGWPILRGWAEVGDSWRRILDGPGNNQFILTNESVVVSGENAWVTLDENLMSSEGTGTIAATNVLARQPDGAWLLVLHHGSPVMAG